VDPQGRTVEVVLAQVAQRQHGVVTRAELLGEGVSADEIKHRLRIGSLIREYRGVYRVGHRAPSTEASYLAAVCACGEGALLSGRAAGYLLGLLKGRPPPPEVTAPTERRIEGLTTRRSRGLDPRDATVFRGIPVTTVPRTIVDLAAVLSPDDLARAFHEAGVLHRTTPAQVEAVLARRPNSPGARNIRKVLRGEVHVTLSKLERAFLTQLKNAGLPLPKTNRPAGTKRVDCRWPDHGLTVELDSYRFHNSRHAWEQDRRREREAHARGDEFRRYTYGDVLEHPHQMLRELRVALRTPLAG
jgi:Transcriptional regulator, AbiEi antitoxin